MLKSLLSPNENRDFFDKLKSETLRLQRLRFLHSSVLLSGAVR